MNQIPLGQDQLTSLATAAALTVPSGAQFALLRAEGQDIRWRDDGTDPTTSVGMLLKASDTAPFLYSGNLSAIKFIETTSGATLDVAFYKI